MVSRNTKKILVIKDLPSNIIEEAILILKSNPAGKDNTEDKDYAQRNRKRDNDFLFKEAEMIINNYIKDNNLHITNARERTRKPGLADRKALINTIINVSLIGSIALLVFIMTKFF